MEDKYSDYVYHHSQIDNSLATQWKGDLFLPPCKCSDSHNNTLNHIAICKEASSSDVFEYSSPCDIDSNQLINLRNHTDESCKSKSKFSYWLCQKYSLTTQCSNDNQSLHGLAMSSYKDFMQSPAFRNKEQLLRKDLKVLMVFNRANMTMSFKEKTKFHLVYNIHCSHYRRFQSYNERKNIKLTSKQRKCTSNRPMTNVETCPFKINLYFDLRNLKWCIKYSNTICHKFHIPTDFDEFKFGRDNIPVSMKKQVTKLDNANAATTTTSNVIMENNNVVLSRHTLYNQKQATRDEQLSNMSDAEQLVKALEDEPNVTYFAMYTHSGSSSLITIPIVKQARKIIENQKHLQTIAQIEHEAALKNAKRKRSLTNYASQFRERRMQSNNNRTDLFNATAHGVSIRQSLPQNHQSSLQILSKQYQVPTSDNLPHDIINLGGYVKKSGDVSIQSDFSSFQCHDLDTSLKVLLRDIIVRTKNALYDKNGDVMVLLACGWARDDDLAVLRKFPEVLHMDTTFGTNKESRPLFNIVVKDSNDKLRTVFRCLLPSEKECIFDTILSSAFPAILGEETCRRVLSIQTDGDSQEINAVRNACKIAFPNAKQNTCLWHMIINASNKTTEIQHPRVLRILRSWLYYTATNTETHMERMDLITHLKVREIVQLHFESFPIFIFSHFPMALL